MKVEFKGVFELPEDSSPSEVMGVILDAFAEFRANRAEGNAEAYVNKRYDGNELLCDERKVAEVQRRLDIAKQIRDAVTLQHPRERDAVQLGTIELQLISPFGPILTMRPPIVGSEEYGFVFNYPTTVVLTEVRIRRLP